MPTVKCSHCAYFSGGKCKQRFSGGKRITVAANKDRVCDEFNPDPTVLAHEADKIYNKGLIPRFAPTWRYYATDKELKERGEEKGPKFVRINPNV